LAQSVGAFNAPRQEGDFSIYIYTGQYIMDPPLESKRSDDKYAVPDMIDIVVSDPVTKEDEEGKQLYTTFLITTHTNLPEYKNDSFSVRRRYSEFESWASHFLVFRRQ